LWRVIVSRWQVKGEAADLSMVNAEVVRLKHYHIHHRHHLHHHSHQQHTKCVCLENKIEREQNACVLFDKIQ
jgi:hypothetical protein